MSKFFEVVGGILTAAVVTVASGVEKACEITSSAACDAAKGVSQVAESVAKAAEIKSKNDSIR
jgi:hypothetical protein